MERVARLVRQLDRETCVDAMKDFYVQLTSNANTLEIPANTPHHFKYRMPYTFQFKETGWKVGLTGVSLPEAPRKIKLDEPFLF